MTFELPRIQIAYVNDKEPGSFGSSVFEADNGMRTSFASSSVAIGFSMKLDYKKVVSSDAGEMLDFLNLIRYDSKTKRSQLSFFMPNNHPVRGTYPVWNTVREREYIERNIITGDFDTALWVLVEFSKISTELVNMNDFSFLVRNVLR